MFPFFSVFFIFIILFALRLRYLTKKREEREKEFWDREKQADLTPDVDLSGLDYIHVPLDIFPFGFSDDPETEMMEDQITGLSKKPLLNLNGKTNTDLKLEYGAGNLERMQHIGDDFSQLTILISDYAKALIDDKMYDDARRILEYGSSINSDISSNYMLLGDCYMHLGQAEKIEPLKEKVRSLHLLLESKIIGYLDSLTDRDEDDADDGDIERV